MVFTVTVDGNRLYIDYTGTLPTSNVNYQARLFNLNYDPATTFFSPSSWWVTPSMAQRGMYDGIQNGYYRIELYNKTNSANPVLVETKFLNKIPVTATKTSPNAITVTAGTNSSLYSAKLNNGPPTMFGEGIPCVFSNLDEGSYSITVTDDANTIFIANPSSIIIDTTAPNTPVINTSHYQTDSSTTTTTVSVTAEVASTITLRVDSYTSGSWMNSAISDISAIGTGSAQNIDITGLSPNTLYRFSVIATDAAGNVSSRSELYEIPVPLPINSTSGRDPADPASLTVAENTTYVEQFYASNNATWSIIGGADSTLFNINASTGALTFNTAPNFEIPGSAAGTNTYNVIIKAIDTVTGGYGTKEVRIGVTDVNENTGGAVCFLADAPVLTPAGYKLISSIKEGDLVRTAAGRDVAVKRVFAKEYQAGASVNPYVIPKGSFGALRALPISPNHEVMTARGMVAAKNLGLPRMKMAGSFTYYNLELEDWVRDNLVVAGVECESLAPAKRITMTKAEFARFVMARYQPSALTRLRTVCFEEADGKVSMPAL